VIEITSRRWLKHRIVGIFGHMERLDRSFGVSSQDGRDPPVPGSQTPSSESGEVRRVPATELSGHPTDRSMRIRIHDFLTRKQVSGHHLATLTDRAIVSPARLSLPGRMGAGGGAQYHHRFPINQACFERRIREAGTGAERMQTPLAH
jgi:hypothetical protein